MYISLLLGGAGVDREANGGTTEAQGVLHRTGDGGLGIFALPERVVVVELQDRRDPARVVASTGLQETKRRSIGIAAGVNGELVVIEGVVAGGVLGKGTGRTMLEPLIHGQDDHLAGTREGAGLQHPTQVLQGAR